MGIIKNHIETKWWIAFTKNEEKNVIHYGRLNIGRELKTGQEKLKIFNNEENWKNELKNKYNINIEDNE